MENSVTSQANHHLIISCYKLLLKKGVMSKVILPFWCHEQVPGRKWKGEMRKV